MTIAFQFSLYFVFFIISSFTCTAFDIAPLYNLCGSSGNYTSNSTFQTNLKTLLKYFKYGRYDFGYSTRTIGENPDELYGMVLCRGDVDETTCHSCIANATKDVLQLCPYSRSATIWYDYCLLQYHNTQFSNVITRCNLDSQLIYMYNINNVSDVKLFNKQLQLLMSSIVEWAAYNSTKKFATGVVNFTKENPVIYGMAQCVPDDVDFECNQCLRNIINPLPTFFQGKEGARVVGVECSYRYEIYSFYEGKPTLKLPLPQKIVLPPVPLKNSSTVQTTQSSLANTTAGLGLGLGIFFALSAGSLCLYWVIKKRKLRKLREEFFRSNGGFLLHQQISSQGVNATAKIFTIKELRRATNNFNENQIVGQGGYGTVYRGTLCDHRIVAIKKSRLLDDSPIDQFINEVVILSQMNHRNIVKLLGCCLETQVPLLVYEFISNGSLHQHIHGDNNGSSLTWEDRLRIAAETAGALAYLHSTTSVPIIHRDVKSANILLDENYSAKVSDFGASKSIPFDKTHVTTLVQGTLGYLDPEYFLTSQLTEKSDVYSFGVVLVELITGEMPISFSRTESGRNLAAYFVLMFDDNSLLPIIESHVLENAGIEQLHVVAKLARICLSLKGEDRPTMKEVVLELEGLRRSRRQKSIHENMEEFEDLLSGDLLHSENCSMQLDID